MLTGLKTKRLRFRRLTDQDKGALLEFLTNKEAIAFIGMDGDPQKHCEDWIQRQKKRYEKYNSGLYALINEEGKFVGQCGLLYQVVDDQEELEIGYHLQPKFWKKGYATEAAIACKQFAFEHKLADSIISIIHVENVNSQCVAERNGMKQGKQTTFMEFPVYIYRVLAT